MASSETNASGLSDLHRLAKAIVGCIAAPVQSHKYLNQLQAVKPYKLLEPKVLAKLGLQTGHPISRLSTKAGRMGTTKHGA